MFVRWKEKPRDPRWGYDANHKWRRGARHETKLLVAYLVESKRIDGKPRQKTHYLASIKERNADKVLPQERFWKDALAKIESISLSPEQRQSIETALLNRVPRPSAEAVAKDEAAFEAWKQTLHSMLKRIRK